MGVAPKKPKFKGKFVNQVEETFGTKPGSGTVSYTHLTLPTTPYV